MKKMKIGIILPAVPGYSETFIWSKIEGLMKNDNIVSLFVNHHEKSNLINIQIPVYSQPDISKPYLLPIILLSLITIHPIILIKFIRQEKISNRNWLTIIKHIIINSHILNKKLNWIHFEFATTGIGRENVAKAMGIKSSVSLRGYDIGLYPYKHTNCYSILWKKIDKVHTISDDLYIRALSFGLDPLIPFKKIPPAINIDFFKSATFTILDNGDKLFRLAIHSPEAFSINIIFNDFYLPKDAELFIYNKNNFIY